MCGIAGFYTFGSHQVSEDRLESMTDALLHRGPDGRGYAVFNRGSAPMRSWSAPTQDQKAHHFGLGNRRLKILDLSDNGAQPMASIDGRYWLTFNGLIYNFAELRRELSHVRFRSTCDTEVLLYWLIHRGVDGLNQLNGIFSFAFFDSKTETLLIARDPVGVKPLYYTRTASAFYFSSEIKSLLPLLPGKPRLRKELVSRFLLNNFMPDPDTLIEGIYKLPPGHFLSIDNTGQFEPRQYWDLSYSRFEHRSLDEWVRELSTTLDGAVNRQMKSDVPLAFFLSGGIDSSLMAAKAARLNQTAPTTYTIGFDWATAPIDRLDLESSRVVAKHFGLNHREIILSPSIVSLLPTVVDTLEEPIADTAALCSFLICEAARKDFTVLISGQGGDELFGGYPVFRAGLASQALSRFPKSGLSALDFVAGHLPYTIWGRRLQTVSRLRRLFFAAKSPWPQSFLEMRSPTRSDQLPGLLSENLFDIQDNPFAPQLTLFEKSRSWSARDQMLFLDFKTFLPALNLTYTDKTSMKNSVDVRVPLLDLEVIRLMEMVPAEFKFDLNHSKTLLKRMCRGLLPDGIIDRKKAGFGLPLKEWLSNDLKALAHDTLAPDRLKSQGLFNPAVPTRWLKEHQAGTGDHSLRLYALLTLEIWMDRFGIST